MYKNVVYLNDCIGQQYVGVKFTKDEMDYILKLWFSVFHQEVDISKIITCSNNHDERDGEYYHITLINVMEFNSIKKTTSLENIEKIFLTIIDDITFKGIGKSIKKGNEAHFVVVNSIQLNSIREAFGLERRDLHITLGFDKKDVFGVSKGVDTIYKEI